MESEKFLLIGISEDLMSISQDGNGEIVVEV